MQETLELSNIKFGKELGEGAYGKVNHVTFKKPFKGYKEAAGKSVNTLRREEVETMKKLDHPNIVTLLGFYENGPICVIILEYAVNGSLCNYLSDLSLPLENDLKCRWMKQAAAALEHLHAHNILHRDIKASNCLLFANYVLKLSDLGLARIIHHTKSTSTIRGTYRYMPPEILRGCEEGQKAEYSEAGDLYAYGYAGV